ETVPEIVALIAELIARGLAYEASGDVYFRVARFPDYGRLSGARIDEMVAQEPAALKEDPRDFALWKASKPDEDTSWESPWGRGRPGWHIECSAMAECHLGPEFQVHGGGLDLRFPHHENEIAQSRGAGREFARLWAHNGMVVMGAEKMSKSLGNIVALRAALEAWGREAVLVFLLGAHYRSPMEYSDVTMQSARAQADDFGAAIRVAATRPSAYTWEQFAAALDDDFDTPRALAILHDWRAAGQPGLVTRGLAIFGLAAEAGAGVLGAGGVGGRARDPAGDPRARRPATGGAGTTGVGGARPPARRDRAPRLGRARRRGRRNPTRSAAHLSRRPPARRGA